MNGFKAMRNALRLRIREKGYIKLLQKEITVPFVQPTSRPDVRVSIIIPVYNDARFLAMALDSVLAQNYRDYEIIIVDDGSTDDVTAVLDSYRQHVCYMYQENAGSAVARNTGLALAQGEYIVFLDADDVLLPGKLRQQAAFLQLEPAVGMVHSGWRLINEAGETIRDVEPWHDAPVLDVETWLRQKPIRMGAMMMRRVWLERVDGFDPALRQSQDVDLMLRLALAGCQTKWIYRSTMCYRVYPTSTIRRFAPRHFQYVSRILDKFFADPRVPQTLRDWEPRARYYNLRWLAWHLFHNDHVAEMGTPLGEAAQHAPFDGVGMALDCLARFALHCVEEKRPLSDLQQAYVHIQQAAALDEATWAQVVRLYAWWLARGMTEDVPRMVASWAFWQAAVLEETAVGLPAETIFAWWLDVWAWVIGTEKAPSQPDFAEFAALSAAQQVHLAQQCMVRRPDLVNTAVVNRFWRAAVRADAFAVEDGRSLVPLLLTAGGQAAMGKKWADARRSLAQALRLTLRQPQTASAWLAFLRAGIAYMGANEYDAAK